MIHNIYHPIFGVFFYSLLNFATAVDTPDLATAQITPSTGLNYPLIADFHHNERGEITQKPIPAAPDYQSDYVSNIYGVSFQKATALTRDIDPGSARYINKLFYSNIPAVHAYCSGVIECLSVFHLPDYLAPETPPQFQSIIDASHAVVERFMNISTADVEGVLFRPHYLLDKTSPHFEQMAGYNKSIPVSFALSTFEGQEILATDAPKNECGLQQATISIHGDGRDIVCSPNNMQLPSIIPYTTTCLISLVLYQKENQPHQTAAITFHYLLSFEDQEAFSNALEAASTVDVIMEVFCLRTGFLNPMRI